MAKQPKFITSITPGRKRPSYQASYSTADIEMALEDVSKKKMSLREVAKKYGVPKSTLSDKLHGKSPVSTKLGRPPIIPEQVEDDMARRVILSAEQGFGLSRSAVRHKVGQLAAKMHLKTPWESIPGPGW